MFRLDDVGALKEALSWIWVLLALFGGALGCLVGALGCLLGALGSLVGALGSLVGPWLSCGCFELSCGSSGPIKRCTSAHLGF